MKCFGLYFLLLFVPLAIFASTPIEIAEGYLGQRETEGFNRSPFIDRINSFCGVELGSPYCASFVSWCFYQANRKAPISAYSPDWFRKNLVSFKDIQPNDVCGIFFPSKGRIAHVGIITGRQGNFLTLIEANTAPEASDLSAKSREGDGVFRRLRPNTLLEQPRNKFSRW